MKRVTKTIISFMLAAVMFCLLGTDKVAAAEVNYEEQYVVMSLEGLTLGQGYYMLPEKMSYADIAKVWKDAGVEIDLEHLTVSQATYAFFKKAGIETNPVLGSEYNTSGFYLSSVKEIDTGNVEVPEVVKDGYKSKNGVEPALNGKTGTDLGEFDYSQTAGWMVSVDNEFINKGAGSYELASNTEENSVHVVRWQFTLFGLGADIGASQSPYYTMADKSQLYMQYAEHTSLINENPTEKESILATMAKLDAAEDEVTASLTCISNLVKNEYEEEGSDEGKVEVTINMNAMTPTMCLKNSEGKKIRLGEPDGYAYTVKLTPGVYTLIGYDKADGKTINGTIDLVVENKEGQTYTLYTVSNIYCANTDWTNEDYKMTLSVLDSENVDRHAVFGHIYNQDTRYSAICYNGDTVRVTLEPLGEKADLYMQKTASATVTANRSFGFNISAPEAKKMSITVPEGSKLRVGTLSNYYIYEDIVASGEAVSDSNTKTDTYTYRVASGTTYYYRVSKDGGVTYWNWVSTKEDTAYTVTEDDLYMNDSSKNPSTVVDDLSANKYDVADLYLTGNEKGCISLDVGDTYKLEAFRNWQAIEGIGNAKTAEPDFHYTIINVNGEQSTDIIKVVTKENSAEAEIQALSNGTAIVLVTYDAMTNKVGMGGDFFSAVWPENTGVLVVNVGENGDSIQTGMVMNEGKNTKAQKVSGDALDAELDVLYYEKGTEGASYTFTPESGVEVTVARPSYENGALTYRGFDSKGITSGNGTYTISGLTKGSNIVRITKNDISTYQVIRAKEVKVTYSYQDAEGNAVEKENLKAGDTITIEYGELTQEGTAYQGLYIPANKLAGIYNMSGTICLSDSEGNIYKGTGNQYLFAYTANAQKVTVKIPKYYDKDTFVLNGNIMESGFGSVYGMHRILRHATGKTPQFAASANTAYMGMLPAASFHLQDAGFTKVTLSVKDKSSAAEITDYTIELADSQGNKTVCEDGSFNAVAGETYTYQIYAAGYMYETGLVEVPEGTESPYGTEVELTKTSAGAWDGKTKIEPSKDAEEIYQIETGAELAWFADEVNVKKNTGIAAVLTSDIDLSGYPWTPIGTISQSYSGIFDGKNHTVKNMYVKDISYAGLFGCAKGIIQNVTVEGKIISSKGSIGAIVGYLQAGTVAQNAKISNCTGKVEIAATGTVSNIGGIAGYVYATSKIPGCVENCVNYGTITAESGTSVGGITGAMIAANVQISQCINYGNVSAKSAVGGIVGNYSQSGSAKLEYCLNAGEVSGESQTGGLIGCAKGGSSEEAFFVLSKCYNKGNVNAGDSSVTASIAGSITNSTVDGCYYSNTEEAVEGIEKEQAMHVSDTELSEIDQLTTETVSKKKHKELLDKANGFYDVLTHTSITEEEVSRAQLIANLLEILKNLKTVHVGVYDYAAVKKQIQGASTTGVILDAKNIEVEAQTAEEAVKKAFDTNNIRYEYVDSPYGGYIASINDLGALENYLWSGWNLEYNDDAYQNGGLSSIELKEEAVLEFHYSLTGDDIGSPFAALPTLERLSIGNTNLSFCVESQTDENWNTTYTYKMNDKVMEGTGTQDSPFVISLTVAEDLSGIAVDYDTVADEHYVTVNGLESTMNLTEPVTFTLASGVRETYYRLAVEKKAKEEEPKNLNDIKTKTLSYLHTQITNPTCASIGGEWSVIALSRAGVEDVKWYHTYYSNLCETVKEKGVMLHATKSTENSRVILALTAIGANPENVEGYNLLEPLADINYVGKQGINGYIYALIALDSGKYNIPELQSDGVQNTREGMISAILDRALPDGGWGLSDNTMEVDITAMAIQALAPYYSTRTDVKTAVDKGLEVLSDAQQADGGFVCYGSLTTESCAQVICALSALGRDADTDESFIKNGNSVLDAMLSFYDGATGGFKHIASGTVDGMASEQAAYTLVAYDRFKNNENSLYSMSDVTCLYKCKSGSHSWDEGLVIKEATKNETGEKIFTCKVCGETKTEVIPKLSTGEQTPTTATTEKQTSEDGKQEDKTEAPANIDNTEEKLEKPSPAKTSVKKVTSPKKKQLKVTWTKKSGVTGYQIQVSTSSKFAKSKTKTYTVKGSKTTSKIIKSLKTKKKYYVRIRTYKKITSNGKSITGYSAWSGKKSIQVK
ncbi:MAG: hypothetical protein PUC12_13745 [Clostridiales bacterium]|nr:hypothetical protein [Clostridiales bacterium]